jgi:hypothetical protein
MHFFALEAFLTNIKLTNKFIVFFIGNIETLNYNKLFLKPSATNLTNFDSIESVIDFNILDLLTLLELLEFNLNQDWTQNLDAFAD